MSDQNVFRSPKTALSRFARIENDALQDNRLSFRARGILAYVLSKPEDWAHSAESLAAPAGVEGRDAITAALTELKSLGYCRLVKERGEHGHFRSRLAFYEDPSRSGAANTSVTDNGFSGVGPATGNQSLVNRAPVDAVPVDRPPVDQSSLKRHSENDCIETTVEKLHTPRKESVSHGMPPAARPRDLVLDALATVGGGSVSEVTKSAWGAAAKAKKEILDVYCDVSADEINRRARNYRQHFKEAALTPSALAKHWAVCDKPPTKGPDSVTTEAQHGRGW